PPLYAPFGEWPKDLHWESIEPPRGTEILSLGPSGRVDCFPEHAVVTKNFYHGDDLERIWRIMHLAGDCSVSLVGRLFQGGVVVGICMPIETPIDPATISTKGERVQMIHQLRELLSELHTKQIVHGDLKPQNLLMCSDGRIRLCDFDNASIEGDGFVSVDMTTPYCSPGRARDGDQPMTRAEDMYAMGTSMWHLYTGKVPLTYDDDSKDPAERQGKRQDRTLAGFLPDMTLIDDPDIASLIETCLAAGPDR
ncbi:kinase-like domain-containing protein, partial [Mycena polygramma]